MPLSYTLLVSFVFLSKRFAMLTLLNIHARLHNLHTLIISSLSISQSLAIIGSNGSGKSAFAALFSGELLPQQGTITGLDNSHVAMVSFEEQQALIDREAKRDDSDITNVVFQGTPVMELFTEISSCSETILHWVDRFEVRHLLDKGFRKLSTGESRKVMLIRALLSDADLMVLDEPFDGLDAHSQQVLKATLQARHDEGKLHLLIVNRLDEVPEWVGHLGFLHNYQLLAQGETAQVLQDPTVQAFLAFNSAHLTLPAKDPSCAKLNLSPEQALVSLRNGKVAYSDRIIFEGLNWTVKPGEHWAVLGPNGCGKSTLLNLISGDHPQCYANDLTVFGIKRGSGESIWEIKQHLGLISAALQWNYKAHSNVLSTVVSGLFDSIGLYNQVDEYQKKIALDWLDQVKLAHKANLPLHQLSYGEQRLVLICRAMIKQPALLILDEPCQGLDEPNRQLVLGFINLLAQQSQTSLLYVSHHQADLLPCFDKRLICTKVSDLKGSQWRVSN